MLRRGMMRKAAGGLPAAYRRVEYLESSGTQYIDTGYTPVQNDAFYVEFMLTSVSPNSVVFSAGTVKQVILLLHSDSTAYVHYFSSGKAATFNFPTTISNIWSNATISGSGDIDINGNTGTKTYEGALTDDPNLWLFRRRNDSQPFYGRIRAFTITNNGTPKMNLIPCYRASDNEPGMYDTVSGTFYTNAGSGEFIIPT